jgi:hypothetical protein
VQMQQIPGYIKMIKRVGCWAGFCLARDQDRGLGLHALLLEELLVGLVDAWVREGEMGGRERCSAMG